MEKWRGKILREYPVRYLSNVLTKPEYINIFCPTGCVSFWLKEEYSSFGVPLWVHLQSEILFKLSKIFRNAPIVNF